MELIARVNSNLRRYEQILNLKGSTQTPSNQLIVGGLVLDQATKEVFVNGRSVRLTKKEFPDIRTTNEVILVRCILQKKSMNLSGKKQPLIQKQSWFM